MTAGRFIERVTDGTGYSVATARRIFATTTDADVAEICRSVATLAHEKERIAEDLEACKRKLNQKRPRGEAALPVPKSSKMLPNWGVPDLGWIDCSQGGLRLRKELLFIVLRIVTKCCKLKQESFWSGGREAEVVLMRKIVLYIAYYHRMGNYSDLSRMLGWRDHSDVRHHVRSMPHLCDTTERRELLARCLTEASEAILKFDFTES